MTGKRHSYEFVKSFYEIQGCKLLENKYINARTKMKFVCSCGLTASLPFYVFRNRGRCPTCGYKKQNLHTGVFRSPIVKNSKLKINCWYGNNLVLGSPFRAKDIGSNKYYAVCRCKCDFIRESWE